MLAWRSVICAKTITNLADLNKEIESEVTRFENATGLTCQLNMKIPDDLPNSYHEIILRSISEALTNIARHASASQASVNLYQSHQSILVEIQDNGTGFDPDKVKSGHFGLLGLRERARLAGGSMTIESNHNQGTIIKMNLPLEPIND